MIRYWKQITVNTVHWLTQTLFLAQFWVQTCFYPSHAQSWNASLNVTSSGRGNCVREIERNRGIYEARTRCLLDNTRLNFYEQSQITNSNAAEGENDCLLNVTIRSAGDDYDQYPIRHKHHRVSARNLQFHMIRLRDRALNYKKYKKNKETTWNNISHIHIVIINAKYNILTQSKFLQNVIINSPRKSYRYLYSCILHSSSSYSRTDYYTFKLPGRIVLRRWSRKLWGMANFCNFPIIPLNYDSFKV